MHPPWPWPHRCQRQRDQSVPSSPPFLARFGLEALATVRVEEDTGAVPRSETGSVTLGAYGLSSSNGRLVRNRPFAHSARLSRHKGRCATSSTRDGDAVDADGAFDESAGCGRRSRVVLTSRCWCQVLREDAQGDGGKRAVHRGEHDISCKPLRGECRVIPV